MAATMTAATPSPTLRSISQMRSQAALPSALAWLAHTASLANIATSHS